MARSVLSSDMLASRSRRAALLTAAAAALIAAGGRRAGAVATPLRAGRSAVGAVILIPGAGGSHLEVRVTRVHEALFRGASRAVSGSDSAHGPLAGQREGPPEAAQGAGERKQTQCKVALPLADE